MGDAFSAGFGMALGLVTGQYILEAVRPPEEVAARRTLLCHKCAAPNPIENKFCGNCGQSLYPPPQQTCRTCNSKMPVGMKFCGKCGSALPKQLLLNLRAHTVKEAHVSGRKRAH